METNMNIDIGLAGYYDIFLRAPHGKPFRPVSCPDTIKNVITDLGLDSCFARNFCESRQYLALGTGTTAATTGDTGLAAYYVTSQTHSTTENGYVVNFENRYVEDYMTHTWINSTGSDKTLYEFGTTWLTTSNPSVFSRIVVSAGVTIPNGYELLVKYTLRKYIPVWRHVKTGSVTIGGVSVPCKYMVIGNNTYASDTSLGNAFAYFNSDGSIYNLDYNDINNKTGLLEPSFLGTMGLDHKVVSLIKSSTEYAGMTDTANYTQPTLYNYGNTVLSAYTAGSFTRTKYFAFLASTLPENTIYGFQLYTDGYYPHFVCQFDSGHLKGATRKWTCGMTTTLTRV